MMTKCFRKASCVVTLTHKELFSMGCGEIWPFALTAGSEVTDLKEKTTKRTEQPILKMLCHLLIMSRLTEAHD